MSGALALGVNGNPNHSIVNRASNINNRQLHHSLDLNEIHLALKRSGSLVYWMPETEVRSRTDLTPYGYCKYYDAVVVVRLAGQDCKFALEYERTPKAARQYVAIRERIEQETAIRHFSVRGAESRLPVVHCKETVAVQARSIHRTISGLPRANLSVTRAAKRKPSHAHACICSCTRKRDATFRLTLLWCCRVIGVSLPCLCGVGWRATFYD